MRAPPGPGAQSRLHFNPFMLVFRGLECRGESLIVGDQGLGIRVWGSGFGDQALGRRE